MFLQHPGQEILIFLVADMDGVTSERSPSSQVFFFFFVSLYSAYCSNKNRGKKKY